MTTNPSSPSFFQEKWQLWRSRYEQLYAKRPWVARFALWGGSAFFVGFFSLLLLFLLVWAGAFGRMPGQEELKAIQNYAAAEVFAADGELLGKYYIENRKNVPIEGISTDIVNALVATEDARFFDHGGIDLRAWGRVLLRTVLLGDESGGGGSTISQQLAKNLFQRQKYWMASVPINKFQEMIIARRLEKVYSKEELLNLYLNTVPFGGNIYGVEVAAQQFFDTTAKEVSTEQAAVLVGMLKANTAYNPVRNPERSQQRRNIVLAQMKKYGYIEPVTCDSLQALPLETNYKRDGSNEGSATYFRDHLRQELVELLKEHTHEDGTPYNLYTEGLKIYTTIDSRMQRYAEESVSEHMSLLQKDFDKHWKGKKPWGNDKKLAEIVKQSQRYKALKEQGLSDQEIDEVFKKPVRMTVFSWKEGDEVKEMSPLDSIKYYYALLNAGFLAMEPGTGRIRAWVGGIDHQYLQYDHVKSRRQVGSTFKPIVYANALRRGFRPCDAYFNRLVTYAEYEDWQPQNSDGKYEGVYSMEGALSKSVNTVAVDLIVRGGVDSVRQLARRMGIDSDIPNGPSIALGTADVSLLDMVQVYGTIANRGRRPEPVYLERIETAEGKVIVEFKVNTKAFPKVLSNNHSDMLTQMMQAVVDSGTARRLRYQFGLYNEIAGKTGTTQSQADGWFLGFTPTLVAGAWVGGEYPSVRFRNIRLGQGANTALPIWGRFMKKVYKDEKFKRWKYASFPDPGAFVLSEMDCPPYLEEMPVLVDDPFPQIDEGDSFNEALDKLLSTFGKKKKQEQDRDRINRNPRMDEEAKRRQEESDRIHKANEKTKKKRERKKKRKKMWDKLFKKD